jgi:hypothetical protein
MVVIVGNLFAVWVAGMTNAWEIYEGGWPMELCLVGFGLCMIMHASGAIWLLTPAGLLLGNSVIFTYFSFTNDWDAWAVVWPVEVFLVLAVVWLPVLLSGRGETTRRIARLLAWLLQLLAVLWGVIFTVVGLALLLEIISIEGNLVPFLMGSF